MLNCFAKVLGEPHISLRETEIKTQHTEMGTRKYGNI